MAIGDIRRHVLFDGLVGKKSGESNFYTLRSDEELVGLSRVGSGEDAYELRITEIPAATKLCFRDEGSSKDEDFGKFDASVIFSGQTSGVKAEYNRRKEDSHHILFEASTSDKDTIRVTLSGGSNGCCCCSEASRITLFAITRIKAMTETQRDAPPTGGRPSENPDQPVKNPLDGKTLKTEAHASNVDAKEDVTVTTRAVVVPPGMGGSTQATANGVKAGGSVIVQPGPIFAQGTTPEETAERLKIFQALDRPPQAPGGAPGKK